jgi:hypothetical protein
MDQVVLASQLQAPSANMDDLLPELQPQQQEASELPQAQ